MTHIKEQMSENTKQNNGIPITYISQLANYSHDSTYPPLDVVDKHRKRQLKRGFG